jgi:hypothetical protein
MRETQDFDWRENREQIERQTALFDLPEHIVPHFLISFGYPADKPMERETFFDDSCVHMEQW